MTLQAVSGESLWAGYDRNWLVGPGFTQSTISASGEKIAFIGRVFNKDRESKSIRKVGFRFGTVTKTGGSTIVVSLQNVLDTSGPVGRPDETQDETYTISNSDSGFTSNSWYTTGNLSADRSVSFGELLAVVLEYGTYGGTDSVQISSVSLNGVKGLSHTTLKTGGSWSAVGSVTPNVLLEFSDGTFGTLKGAVPASGFTSFTYKQDTGTADEHALQFQVPFPCKIDGAGAVLSISAGTSNFDFVVYDGTTEMTGGTVSVDANTVRDTSVRHCDVLFSQAIQLEANHDYYLSIKPTQTSNTVTLYVIDVNASGHFQAHPMGETWKYTSRLDLGSWASATNTRRPLMGLWMCAFDDAAGAPVTGYMGMP